ncbi:CobW family GTP-binding protein [Allonocardiopsis opalescens]|uniref:G3E family GTPase n=1 Tax=Allonocardiopsis opalescens TaxID=1144618 RepID=A0A2T0Q9K9_9ACTN|nr:GTP-binding protein [Allonocardiopsis opalescens]PRY00500.1 G3E family GTPase [Allonocardiopsis opalescens]
MSGHRPVPVVLVGGLHRRARAAAVHELLGPGAVAVRHDLSRVDDGIVHRTVRDRFGVREHLALEPAHGCASCTLREDLIGVLLRLAEQPENTLLVVELWDSVEPRALAESLCWAVLDGRPLAHDLAVAAVITAVDADRLVADLCCEQDVAERGIGSATDSRPVAEVLAHQIEYPTALAVHGADRDAAVRRQAAALLGQLNPAAMLLPTGRGRLLPLARGRFDADAAAARADPAGRQFPDSCAADGVTTVTWRRRRPLHPGRLYAALDEVVGGSLRSRGRFWLASRPATMLVWDAAGNRLAVDEAGPWLAALPGAARGLAAEPRRLAAALDWAPRTGDRLQQLSFTGTGLDARALTDLLDSCLLTDDELHAGEDAWTHLTDPFRTALREA